MNRELLTAIGLEALYRMASEALARQGAIVDRQTFAYSPGWPIMIPRTAIELAQVGAVIIGWQGMYQIPSIRPVTGLNG